ncbi:delta-class carbonic anhydrase [Jiella sp. M17.18]|uniref:delta-class carbonic anhydrase n=1 Tax=Jiella sp. M17.18 TaxID=3234247 RepID=UPI0034E00B19
MTGKRYLSSAMALALLAGSALPAAAADICQGFGPQSPRDISSLSGLNTHAAGAAPPAETMNLCNINVVTSAEHRGPGFSIAAGKGDRPGFKCNGFDQLTPAELKDPEAGHGSFQGVKPGDTIEVHWVYTSCAVKPGRGLGACWNATCSNPTLRVESQVFLLVNDPKATNFLDYVYQGHMARGLAQPRALPSGTGKPVVYAGSMTGPQYSEAICSPLQATWSVRPQCEKLDIESLDKWARYGNVFQEDRAHGVRALVKSPALLSEIPKDVAEMRWDLPLPVN